MTRTLFDASKRPGRVVVTESDTDPGDMGEPRDFSADGVFYITVPPPQGWANGEPELDPAREVMGLPDAPAWLILHRIRHQGFETALEAIDEVALTADGVVALSNESWGDGFRQGWRAAREAVERKLTASLNTEAERARMQPWGEEPGRTIRHRPNGSGAFPGRGCASCLRLWSEHTADEQAGVES